MMTMVDRRELLSKWREAKAHYNAGLDGHMRVLGTPGEIGVDDSSSVFQNTSELQSARASYDQLTTLEETYFRELPRVVMAPCPICSKPLYRSFDPFGLDGLWWRSDAQPDEPPACLHFCRLLGAVDLRDSRPQPDFDVHPGPGAPFVIPRLLEQPGMLAVVSQIDMADGARAYPIAYFAPRRPPIQTLTASWARTNFVYSTQLGAHLWRLATEAPLGQPGEEVWDFALEPWMKQNQLRWCDPGSDRTTLSAASPDACPFVNLSGVRSPQTILHAMK
jgi:hypothetical protein